VRRLLLGILAATLVFALPTTLPGTASAAVPETLPGGLAWLPAETTQVIVVSSGGYRDTFATLTPYEKVNGTWVAAFAPMSARIGGRGFSGSKREGDRTTPTGLYRIGGTMYGLLPNPGVRYAYHRLVKGDYWNENARTRGYNTFQHGRNPGGPSEALWRISPQYTFFAVINYNIPVVRTKRALGSGVFLHEMKAGRATAGCVSLGHGDLLNVLTWLDPARSPRIAMGPDAVIRTL
jgi:L,D-peptidoglycan transpeptidase YkuD (ErfK/YbiS/YcfS/YnhG family)